MDEKNRTDTDKKMNKENSPTDYASERERLREKYSGSGTKKPAKKPKKSKKVTPSTILLMVSLLLVVLLIVLLFIMLGHIEDAGDEKKSEEDNTSDTQVISSMVDTATEEESTASSRENTYIPNDESADEIIYANSHMGETWYNMDKYSALCKDVDDTYFEDVCFIGDSRTKGLLEYSVLPRWHGFYKIGSTAAAACMEREYTLDGSSYTNILNIIEWVDYDIYYVGYGTNELGYGDADKFIEELKVVIDKIRECHPDAIIYVENVLPMGQSFSDNNPGFSNYRAWKYNEALRKMCQEYGDLIYLDIASCMKDPETGAAINEYIGDGLHYTPDGCKKIMEFIRGAVVEKK